MVKNLPVKARDASSIPGPGRSHVSRNKPVCCSYWSPWALEPVLRNHRSHRSEKPVHCNEQKPPLSATTENPPEATKTQSSHKEINNLKIN